MSGNETSQIRRVSLEIQQNGEEEGGDGGGFTCVKVLAGFVGVHGAMTNRRLYCSQWRDYACAGKELVDG